jgi:hypothetical protein
MIAKLGDQFKVEERGALLYTLPFNFFAFSGKSTIGATIG